MSDQKDDQQVPKDAEKESNPPSHENQETEWPLDDAVRSAEESARHLISESPS